MSDIGDKKEAIGAQTPGMSPTVVPMVSTVKVVSVFRVLVNFSFADYYFYFLNADAVTVFLSLIDEKAKVEEMNVNKSGRKFYLPNADNSLGQHIQVEERDAEGVRKAYENLKAKLNVFLDSLSPLEIGMAETAILIELRDCHS